MQPARVALRKNSIGNRRALLRQVEPGRDFLAHPAGEEIAQAPVVSVEQTYDGVFGTDHFAGGSAQTGQKPLRVPFRGQLQAQLDHRIEPRHHHVGFLRQLGQEQAKMVLPELFGRRRSHRRLGHAQDPVNHLEDLFRFGRLGDDVRDAALHCESTGLGFKIGGAVEYNRNPGKLRILPQSPDELESIHRRHEQVGDYQIGHLGLRQGQCFGAVAGLAKLMSGVAQDRDQQIARGRVVIHCQNRRYSCLAFASDRDASSSATSTSGSIGRNRNRWAPRARPLARDASSQ